MSGKLIVLLLSGCTCVGQTTLSQYLGLSDPQATSIRKLNSDYQSFALNQNTQQFFLNSQLSDLLRSPSPDPIAVGTLVANLEYGRRGAVAKQADVQKNVAAQLSSSQGSLVQALTQAVELLPLAQDAGCAYLARPITNYWFVSGAPFYYIGAFIDNYAFTPNVPAISPAPTANFCDSLVFPISIRTYLSLSDSQIASIATASASFNDFKLRSSNRLADLDAQIAALPPTSDAVTVGLLYVEKDRVNADVASRSDALIAAAQAQLTPPQLMKLAPLQNAVILNNTNLIYNAVSCNLLLLPVGSSNFGTTLTGDPTFCSL